jgi:predicted lipid carrier protein YhbT
LTQVNVRAAQNPLNPGPMPPRKPLPLRLPPLQSPLRLTLRLLPARLVTTPLAALITHLLRGQPLTARLAPLAGRRVSLLVTDLGSELRFRITAAGLADGWASDGREPWDVRIRGTFDDFWRLATRAEDPDTLFFQRRLSVEGDTETGLALKNLLDALEYDWPAHVAQVLGPLAALLPARPRR